MEDGKILNTPWTLRIKNAKISGRHIDTKGINVIESHDVDQTHALRQKVTDRFLTPLPKSTYRLTLNLETAVGRKKAV